MPSLSIAFSTYKSDDNWISVQIPCPLLIPVLINNAPNNNCLLNPSVLHLYTICKLHWSLINRTLNSSHKQLHQHPLLSGTTGQNRVTFRHFQDSLGRKSYCFHSLSFQLLAKHVSSCGDVTKEIAINNSCPHRLGQDAIFILLLLNMVLIRAKASKQFHQKYKKILHIQH